MPKAAPYAELTLGNRPSDAALPVWLYRELRAAVLSGRLRPGSRLPSTREFARQHGVSRGTVVAAFEQLTAEGYLEAVRGSGTKVSTRLPAVTPRSASDVPATGSVRAVPPVVPFRFYEPGLSAFPMHVWARIASRRLRRATERQLSSGDAFGYAPLREAVADYLRRSRGVVCRTEQVAIVAGTNQSLDLMARLILRPGDPVWMEDPGYPGAIAAFERAAARIVPMAVDASGLNPAEGGYAKAVYLTPAHQFPLGMTMPLERRLAILDWARRHGAYVLEDDYDSEFRYSGKPVPAMQGLDPAGSVIFMGSFSKMLFTSLRLAYMVVPESLIEPLSGLRAWLDRFSPTLDQAILCDFITEGHLARHLRRMRDLYGARLAVLRDSCRRHLEGAVHLPDIHAGLHIPAHLAAPLEAEEIDRRAAAAGLEAWSLGRFALKREDVNALLLGFAAFEERTIREGVERLAAVISRPASPRSASRRNV